VSRVINNTCLLVRYRAMDVLLLRANFGNVFTESLPSSGHMRHNIAMSKHSISKLARINIGVFGKCSCRNILQLTLCVRGCKAT
jgi:hypothetical protein